MGQLLFKKCFWKPIRDGQKRSTIRRWDRPRLRAGQRVYSLGLGWLVIESIEVIEDPALLSLDDARADGFNSVSELHKTLIEMYPNKSGDGKTWFLLRFRTETLLPDAAERSKLSGQGGLFTTEMRRARRSGNPAADERG